MAPQHAFKAASRPEPCSSCRSPSVDFRRPGPARRPAPPLEPWRCIFQSSRLFGRGCFFWRRPPSLSAPRRRRPRSPSRAEPNESSCCAFASPVDTIASLTNAYVALKRHVVIRSAMVSGGRPVGRPRGRATYGRLVARVTAAGLHLLQDLVEVVARRGLQRRERLVAQQVFQP